MKKSSVVLILVAMIMSSCAFVTTCPTYSKKDKDKKEVSKATRI